MPAWANFGRLAAASGDQKYKSSPTRVQNPRVEFVAYVAASMLAPYAARSPVNMPRGLRLAGPRAHKWDAYGCVNERLGPTMYVFGLN